MRSYEMSGIRGESTLTPPISDTVNVVALAAATAETVTWPTGARYCNIVGDGSVNYYVRVGGTATVPSADVSDGTGSARNVAQRQKGNEASFSIIAAEETVITIEFWGTQF